MAKQVTIIALAFVGLVVGAGFASGQEVLQFFVAFGKNGVWGALLAATILGISGLAILQLGSYFRAKEHSEVYDRVTHPALSRAFDLFTTFTLFCMGMVMIAGAGANLQQQFGTPVWVGSAIMVVLVILVGMLDVDKVTTIIGTITPFIIVFIVGAIGYALTQSELDFAAVEPVAQTIEPAVSNWLLSALNYVALALALAVSMALVMGGDHLNPRLAGIGGFLGGVIFGVLLVLSTVGLLFTVDEVKDVPMPMLELVNRINPHLSIVMAFVIYGMIFNTAIGMFYALAKRISADKPKRFMPSLTILAVLGFGLSFVGFESLVGMVYPVIGYVGMVLISLLVFVWMKRREDIAEESRRRLRIRELLRRKWDRDIRFSGKEGSRLAVDIEESNLDNRQLHRDMSREVVAEIEADPEADVEERWTEVEQRWEKEAALEEAETSRSDQEAAEDAGETADHSKS